VSRPTIAILQPNYIPWLGNFDLIAQSDVWVWYDDVQYTRRDWRNRNRVAGRSEPVWLTIPVSHGPRSQRICDVAIDSSRPWAHRHLETFRHLYSRAPYAAPVDDILNDSLTAGHHRLVDLVIEINEKLCRLLGIDREFVRSSTLAGVTGRKSERLIAICRRLGAGTYLSGPAGEDYLDASAFEDAGIALRYAFYDYPPYARGGQPFVANLSVIDPLCWTGAAATAALLHRRVDERGTA
jgi:hypothetical protein